MLNFFSMHEILDVGPFTKPPSSSSSASASSTGCLPRQVLRLTHFQEQVGWGNWLVFVCPTTTHLYLWSCHPPAKNKFEKLKKKKNRMLAVLLHHVLHLPRGSHVVHLLQPTSLRLVQQCIQVFVTYYYLNTKLQKTQRDE